MKIQVFSDIHIELSGDKPFQIPDSDSEVIVLAGDIGVGLQGIEWAASQSQRLGKLAMYAPGNQEYYGFDITRHDDAMRNRARELGIVFLNDQKYALQNYSFIGPTLWTSFQDERGKKDWFAATQAQHGMADFHVIRMESRSLTPNYSRMLHASATRFIERSLKDSLPERMVVITHHAPSHRCSNADFEFGPMTRTFSSNADYLLGRSGSALWVYGHTHACLDQVMNGTRVVSNQRGYPRERNHGFDPNKVIEI